MLETIVISSILGKEVVTQTISESTKGLYHSISGLMSNNHFLFKELLEELDINSKIVFINTLIKDIKKLEHINESISLCLNQLNDIIRKINEEIIEITKNIEIDKTRWFNSFRNSSYISKVHNLKAHNNIMDYRLELLLKLINFK